MSDTGNPRGESSPTTLPLNTAADPLAPPADFGAEIAAAFAARETRSQGTATAAGDTPEAPLPDGWPEPGNWPGGSTVDAAAHIKRIDTAAAETETAKLAGSAGEPATSVESAPTAPGETDPPAVASGDDASTTAGGSADDAVSAPDTESATGEEDGGATADTDAVAPPTAPPSGYTWSEGGQSAQFTDQQVRDALVLAGWAENLAPENRAAFAAIEQGQAVAVPRADFDQFNAWRTTRDKQTRDADLTTIEDPTAAKLIAEMRDELAALKGQPQAQPFAPTAQQQPFGQSQQYTALNANLDGTAQRLDAGMQQFREQQGLTDSEFQVLHNAALQQQGYRFFSESLAQTNPATGQLVRPADPAEVAQRALAAALAADPQLHNAIVGRRLQGAPATPPSGSSSPLTTPDADTLALAAKKARSASVASAPSATVTPPRNSVAQMTPQDIVAAMEAELASAMNGAG